MLHKFLNYLTFTLIAVSASAQTGFVENKGQFDAPISFRAQFDGHPIYLDNQGFSVLLHDEEKWGKYVMDFHHSKHQEDSILLAFHLIKYKLIGSDLSNFKGQNSFDEYYNYFQGDDPSKWVGGAKSYSKVYYTNVYPNIDLEFEAIDLRFKYNFILHPGADINDIKIEIQGSDSVIITPDRIAVTTRFGTYSEVMPVSYEVHNDEKTQIKMSYVLKGSYIGFETPFFKNKVKTVIDPELIFSTYSGSGVDNFGFTATYDSAGNLYSGGIVTTAYSEFPFGKYPVTAGAYDQTFNGGTWDIAINKYSADGSQLIYATYLGGSGNDYPHSLIVADNNELIVFGSTASSDYPTTTGVVDRTYNGGTDILITRFNEACTGLVASTYIGGSNDDGVNRYDGTSSNKVRNTNYFYADDYRGEVNLDKNGNIYIATCSQSSNFPTTVNAIQRTYLGSQSGVVFRLNPNLTVLDWSTYYGGNGKDALYSIDVTSNNELLLAGGTTSDLLMPGMGNGYQATNNGGKAEGFVCKISEDGSQVISATYYGTASYDQILLAELDQDDNVYVVGHSEGSMPVKGNVFTNNDGKQFISKFDPTLKELLVSTVYGSGRATPDITINAFLVDDCGKVYVSGWGTNSEQDLISKQLRNMPLTADAAQPTTDGQDFHILVLERDFASVVYATYFGGNRTGDHVDGGTSRFDKKGIIYQSVCSSCPDNYPRTSKISDFPTTTGAYSQNNPSPRCSNASFKMAVVEPNYKPITPSPMFTTDVADTVTVTVFDTFAFAYQVIDPEGDSLLVTFEVPDALRADLIDFQDSIKGLGRVNANFRMFFTCKNAEKTYKVKVHAKDAGCPTSAESFGEITIVVREAPTLPPPEVLCLNFVNDGTLRIDWQATDSSRYFYKMTLHKIDPAGNESVLISTSTQTEGSYTDTDVINPRNRDYSYYLIVENICGKLGSKSYLLSSIKESEVPVEATYLKTATVNGKKVEVTYLKSKEEDFGHYEIYKGSREDGLSLQYLTSIFDINDTTFLDSAVSVDYNSYCYQVRVSDNCGHLSKYSNEGCTIVIRGEAINDINEVPRFKFDLKWDEYKDWPNGVAAYELVRAVDTGLLKPIVRVSNLTQKYLDSDLDYDWGGYWYSVYAYENAGEYNAVSRSNDIYLIQPPLVFVPNAVTANGDNLNDNFRWSDVFVKEFEMQVYNRWGEKVFETTDKNARWDGEFKDTVFGSSNVYFWIVTYKGWDNYIHRDNGTLTILR